ncbi:MAG: type II toxin-antitoxin system VapC family toxin [Alphaproteobacteria bacterium]|nr:type II toxin-antitoxin system VapC family toxin [Alphaproteobacteria bacterium]
MIIDTSALIAIILNEPEARAIVRAIKLAPVRLICSVTLFEVYTVILSRSKEPGVAFLERLIAELKIETENFTEKTRIEAQRGFYFYGKGRHEAKLNFGDCMVYALAKELDEPLLCKGDDFTKTDITLVSY